MMKIIKNHKHPELHKEEAKAIGVEFGDGLGQWLNEFKQEDTYIKEICVLGAKSYAYKTSKDETVIKK